MGACVCGGGGVWAHVIRVCVMCAVRVCMNTERRAACPRTVSGCVEQGETFSFVLYVSLVQFVTRIPF